MCSPLPKGGGILRSGTRLERNAENLSFWNAPGTKRGDLAFWNAPGTERGDLAFWNAPGKERGESGVRNALRTERGKVSVPRSKVPGLSHSLGCDEDLGWFLVVVAAGGCGCGCCDLTTVNVHTYYTSTYEKC
jgi:hypothetical protein